MSFLDDLPDLIADALGDDFRNGVLKIPGTSSPDGQGGWIPSDPVEHTCKALVDDYSDFRRSALGIPGVDRKIIVLAATVQGGARPAVGHTLSIEGRDWQLVGVSRDPASATWECQGR
jgi:hypothetical protein